MSAPVLIGFAGVLVAAAATGMLAGRCVREPQLDFVAWTAATLALTIALAAGCMGFARGFGPVTFRAVQLTGLLLAPLWIAWGLVELAAASEAVRFGMRLASAALTVVASVILATDPLSGPPFGKSWPLTGAHFGPVSRLALDVVQAVAVLAVVAGVALAVARAGPRWQPAMVAVVPVGLAVLMTAGMRFALPARAAYPLLGMVAAALAWFGASRAGGLPRRGAGPEGRRGGVRDDRGRYRSGDEFDDGYWPDDSRGRVPDSQYATFGQRGGPPGAQRSAPPDPYRRPGGPAGPGALSGSGAAGGPGRHSAEVTQPDRAPGAGTAPGGAESAAGAPARPYGRILIFTLLDDRVAEFDRLAEQAAEEVRTGEPDTLVYVIHLVPNAPMQRIFYEIYRDRAAFESHENRPYMQRFVAERRSCVLATNVIELRLKYAKVAPLPNPQAPAGPPRRAQLPASPQPLPAGSSGVPGGQRQAPARPRYPDQQPYPGRR